MKRIFINILFIIILFFLICGCAKLVEDSNPNATGEKISIFSAPPQRPYEVISDISATTFIDNFTNYKDAENAALTNFLKQAEKVDADGIIEVYLEFLKGEELVSYTPWEELSNFDHSKNESVIGDGCVLSPSIKFKGKAIKFVD